MMVKEYPKNPRSCPICNGHIAPQAKQCRPCANKESMERIMEGKLVWEKLHEDVIESGKKNGLRIKPYK
jgi:hypothetical protein